MFILRLLLASLQIEFQDKKKRGDLFVQTLLSIILPFTGSRSSSLFRSLVTIFQLKITLRRFYIFMASPKLPWNRLWLAIWKLIPNPETEGRILLAADDSINPKTGKKIYGCHTFFDHSAKANQQPYVWSQNIVMLGLLQKVHGRWACLPLSWCFYRLKKDITSGFKTKLEQLVDQVEDFGKAFKAPLLLITDSWFGNNKVFQPLRRRLGSRIHILSRLRSNTSLHDPVKLPRIKQRGRPRKYGIKKGTATTLSKKLKKRSKKIDVFLYGKVREIAAIDRIFILKTLNVPVRVVWIFYRSQWVALFTTDLSLTVAQIIEYYGARWKIESGFKELKQDIGSQKTQARAKNAVTNHLHFCMMAVTFSWIYALRASEAPKKRCQIKDREYFSFSDVRYAISEAVAQKEFSSVLNKTRKPKKNNFITAFLKLAA